MTRIQSIDIFRVVAIFAVIAIHTAPFKYYYADNGDVFKYLYLGINILSRFAVPFFFVISGFLWGVKLRCGAEPVSTAIKAIKRLFFIFLVWCLIYLLPYNLPDFYIQGALAPFKSSFWVASSMLHHPFQFFTIGTQKHLWFLISLAWAYAISVFFIKYKSGRALLVFSLVLYLLGVLAGSYANTPAGIEFDFRTRNGPFFGTLFFATGYFLSGFNISIRWFWLGMLIFIFGCGLHFFEIYVLWHFFETSPIQDFVFGTYFMGVGAAMASLSDHPVFRNSMLSGLGQLTLGIYLIHIMVIDLLAPLDAYFNSLLWEVGKTPAVFVLSVLSTLLLSKTRLTKKIIM